MASDPETILCDTSFVSIAQAGTQAVWPDAVIERLSSAVKAINIVTLAELRDGHIYAGWGERRRNEAEKVIASYLLVPLDMAVVNECARLRAACRKSGVAVPDNDIWIAATAVARAWPMVSCDDHFEAIPGLDHILLDRP